MPRISTKLELSPFGYLGIIYGYEPNGLMQGRYINVTGSRRKVKRALRHEIRRASISQSES
jgi:hypothetical protein